MTSIKLQTIRSAAIVVLAAARIMRRLALQARDYRAAGIAGAVIDTIEGWEGMAG